MNTEERLNNLENKINILSLESQNLKKDFSYIKTNIDLLVGKLIKDKDKKGIKKDGNINNNKNVQELFRICQDI